MPSRRFSTLIVVVAASWSAGCSPAAPTPQPQPAPNPGGTGNPPAATFAVAGYVADTAARGIDGVRVEVLTGTHQGTTVFSDANGKFEITPALEHLVQLRASKPGYLDDVRVVGGSGGGNPQQMGFQLRSPNPPVDLTGRHRITFTADSACTQLPEVARRRTYQSRTTTTVQLYGATFGGDGAGYLWRVLYLGQFEDFARYSVQDPPVWELLPNDAYVVIWGDAAGTVTADAATLDMWGHFTYCDRRVPGQYPACAVPEVTCSSARHRMTIERY